MRFSRLAGIDCFRQKNRSDGQRLASSAIGAASITGLVALMVDGSWTTVTSGLSVLLAVIAAVSVIDVLAAIYCGRRTSEMSMRAYVALDVGGTRSDAVVQSLLSPTADSERIDNVELAAAVWGPWDVICKINAPDLQALERTIVALRYKVDVHYTETFIVHSEASEIRLRDAASPSDSLAFVFIRSATGQVEAILREVRNSPALAGHVVNAVCVHGRYDIIIELAYNEPGKLGPLVEKELQGILSNSGINQTATSIRFGSYA